MFEPKYRVTPHLLGLFEKIAAHTAYIKSSDVKLPFKINLERDVVNRSVHSSTWIEGNTLTLAQVTALSEDKPVAAEAGQKREVQNCIKALRWILKSKTMPLTEERLLRIHRLMTQGLLPAVRCGKYRAVQNYIVNARKAVIYTPPAPDQVKPRMRALFAWLSKDKEVHAIARCAIFHHELVAIHPFVDGNGRVARAGSQWLLFEKGYEPLHTLGLDEFFAQDRARYYQMIQQAHEMDGDYTHWIEYVAGGLWDALNRIAGRLKGSARWSRGKRIALTPKQEELLVFLQGRGALGSAEICQKMRINRARVNQLMAPLVKAGIVIQEGKTRAARYVLAG